MDEEEVHTAIGKNFRKEKANILWAAANFPRATIVLVHVHWPSKWMPFMGGKLLYKFADEKEKEMHRGRETEAMVKMLLRYKSLCDDTREVRAHYLTHDDILAGVVNLVKKLKIKRIVIGSRNMSKNAVLRKCSQVWVVLNGKYLSTSNDHLEHTGGTVYGGSSELLASIHELSEVSDGYATPPSDFYVSFQEDDVVDEDGVIPMDGDEQLEKYDVQEPEQGIEETKASEEVGKISGDEIRSSRNMREESEKLMEEMDKLQRKLKELQDERHNHEESILSPIRKNVLLKEKTLPKQRYPELQIPEHIAQYSMSHIGKATGNFYSRNLIGEGGYGLVYKGKLGGMPVAIKLLRPHGKPHGRQGFPEYQQEEKTLPKQRYPELQIPEHIAQYSMSHIGKATGNFYSRNLIGEGGYGLVYKGKLGGMPVAIKLLRPHGKPHGRQGFPEYQQEVVVLSRVKHPHIVKLIGVCPESCGLVYEYLPNGTLMDGLSKGLPWKDLIRILAEQRSALAHLHSSRPHAIIHADLKLTNILLDAGNMSRLGDFGTARVVQMKPLEEETICRRTNPMGTMGYMDPVFFTTGELTAESDVYAFGVVILQVLTGLLGLNIVEQVQEAMKMDAAHGLLDASAGSWPEVQAERLMRLALRCCNLERNRRPAATSDADWRSLDILRTMATASKSRKWSHAN